MVGSQEAIWSDSQDDSEYVLHSNLKNLLDMER